jgi:hypothetical protein
MDADEPVVFRFRRQARRTWVGLVLLPLGLVWWAIDRGTVVSYVLAALGALLFAWAWLLMLRVHSSSNELTVGRDGLRTSMWSIAWAGVHDARVEQRQFVGDTLVIEPFRPDDIQNVPARGAFVLIERVNRLSRFPKLSIPQKVLERPLAEVLAAMEERSGRTFGRATLDPANEEEP